MFPSDFSQPDAFGQGGVTYQLDHHLRALQHATWIDDARLYANLVSQVAAILRPKLDDEEYRRLKRVKIDEGLLTGSRREMRRQYERLLFEKSQDNLAELLLLASKRGIYAKEDASPPPLADGSEMAIK